MPSKGLPGFGKSKSAAMQQTKLTVGGIGLSSAPSSAAMSAQRSTTSSASGCHGSSESTGGAVRDLETCIERAVAKAVQKRAQSASGAEKVNHGVRLCLRLLGWFAVLLTDVRRHWRSV